ncbi:MAG: flavodoxin family protein [Lentisphaeria bacterium]|nr:flavodoxin family protein [Lentisphaeria bacterium]
MKISILYYSKTGRTREMAETVAEGARAVPGAEVRLFPLDAIDTEFLAASKAVLFGTPTYLAGTCWQWKKWFDEPAPCPLGGKLGAVFATADFAQGGADIAIQTLLGHMMVKGMLVYSGGGACGAPYIHLGAVALRENFESSKPMFRIFGERVARKALELFPAAE